MNVIGNQWLRFGYCIRTVKDSPGLHGGVHSQMLRSRRVPSRPARSQEPSCADDRPQANRHEDEAGDPGAGVPMGDVSRSPCRRSYETGGRLWIITQVWAKCQYRMVTLETSRNRIVATTWRLTSLAPTQRLSLTISGLIASARSGTGPHWGNRAAFWVRAEVISEFAIRHMPKQPRRFPCGTVNARVTVIPCSQRAWSLDANHPADTVRTDGYSLNRALI